MPDAARHVVIHGRVQGVWFRGWMRQQADRLGIRGWVRNRRDGTVEAVIQGEAAAVDEMLARCRSGPPAAKVSDIKINAVMPSDYGEFRQLPTE